MAAPSAMRVVAMRRGAALLTATLIIAAWAVPAASAAPSGGSDALVTVGSPRTTFPRDKQNEPAVGIALDATRPSVLVAGANEEIDNAPCAAADCSFTPGVGDSGVYFSFDAGRSWRQPTYTGWTARNGSPQVGPIGTIPWYFERGLVSDGDPALAFGPRPGPHGFSWNNGSRLYYASLTSNFPGKHTFNAQEAIAVSRTDDVAAAASGNKNAWLRPVIASKRLKPVIFSDKEAVWSDNAATSKFFGNVYVCWTSFGATTSPIVIARSTDGGSTWSPPHQLVNATPTVFTGPTACTVRTDSAGTVYAFWHQINWPAPSQQMMARSFDGGRTFEAAREVAKVIQVGAIDPTHVANQDSRFTFDGVAGARTWSGLSVDIANGAPSGKDATNQVVMTWSDGRRGLNHEQALIQVSNDRGAHWTTPVAAQQAGDRPDFPAVAISPNGGTVYLTYDAFLEPWRTNTSSSRPMQGVVRAAAVDSQGRLGPLTSLHRGAVGDARGSSENNLCCEFLGDYNYAAATRSFVTAVWNDVRDAAVCPAMNVYRQSLSTGRPLPTPAPRAVCPARFGNSDIFGGSYPG